MIQHSLKYINCSALTGIAHVTDAGDVNGEKPAKAPRKKRPKLDVNLLLGPTGLPLLKERMEKASFSGGERGREVSYWRSGTISVL